MQPHEHFGDRARERGVHGELVALPVHRRTEAAQLIGDDSTGFLFPFPNAFDKGVATEFDAALSRRIQLAFHHHLRGNPGVVRARLPQGVEAAHSLVADERIQDGVLKGMPHVQRAGDVGRRDDDGKAWAPTARREIAAGFPRGVDP